jgi:hypothetical protein
VIRPSGIVALILNLEGLERPRNVRSELDTHDSGRREADTPAQDDVLGIVNIYSGMRCGPA